MQLHSAGLVRPFTGFRDSVNTIRLMSSPERLLRHHKETTIAPSVAERSMLGGNRPNSSPVKLLKVANGLPHHESLLLGHGGGGRGMMSTGRGSGVKEVVNEAGSLTRGVRLMRVGRGLSKQVRFQYYVRHSHPLLCWLDWSSGAMSIVHLCLPSKQQQALFKESIPTCLPIAWGCHCSTCTG